VVHTYNPSTPEAEAGGWRVQNEPEPHGETLSQNNNNNNRNNQTEGHDYLLFPICISESESSGIGTYALGV
jgi:hypothetical protein